MSHQYMVKYDISVGKFSAQDAGDSGLTDALVLVSIIFHENGSRSQVVMSKDGRTDKELSDIEQFKTWVLWANKLSQSAELSEGHKLLCSTVFEAIREQVLKSRGIL